MPDLKVGRSCLEKDLKETLQAMAAKDPKMTINLIDFVVPDCANVPAAAKEASGRAMPEKWSSVEGWQGITFIDGKGSEKSFDSPSSLLKALNISTSGIQCDPAGKTCRSTSQIESLQIKGYTVYGNGEGTEAVKGVSKHITVIDPEWVVKMHKKEKGSKK